jgi:hypothetical protein
MSDDLALTWDGVGPRRGVPPPPDVCAAATRRPPSKATALLPARSTGAKWRAFGKQNGGPSRGDMSGTRAGGVGPTRVTRFQNWGGAGCWESPPSGGGKGGVALGLSSPHRGEKGGALFPPSRGDAGGKAAPPTAAIESRRRRRSRQTSRAVRRADPTRAAAGAERAGGPSGGRRTRTGTTRQPRRPPAERPPRDGGNPCCSVAADRRQHHRGGTPRKVGSLGVTRAVGDGVVMGWTFGWGGRAGLAGWLDCFFAEGRW